MAVTSIWSVKGRLGEVLDYVANPEKIAALLDYAGQEGKTEDRFISGINCLPATVHEQMIETKRQFGKLHGTAAYHGIQSFVPGEVTPEAAHEIGVKLAKKLWGDRYQVLVTTHLDQEHLHNHFVVNPVSFIDGIRYYRSNQDYADMQRASDTLCRAYALSVIEHAEPGRSKHYAEWQAERNNQPTYRGTVRADVDAAIAESTSERQLWENLRRRGYAIKFGQDITVRPEGKDRGLKLHRNFGEDYSIERIRARILENTIPIRHITPPASKPPRQMRTQGSFTRHRKCAGLRALYFSYLYKMGILPRKRERRENPKRVYFLYREDIRFIQRISAGASVPYHEKRRERWRKITQ